MANNKPKLFINLMFDSSGLESLARLKETCQVTQWPREQKPNNDEFMKQIEGVDAIFLASAHRITDKVLAAAGPQLKVIGSTSVGYNHIDVDACKKAGVKVGFTPDVLSNTVAELAIALLLASARRLQEGIQSVRNGEWGSFHPEWMTGHDIHGSTIGIVGLGRIGAVVAKRLRAFDIARLLYHSRNPSPHATSVNADFVDFETLLANCDFVIACCALTSETEMMFNEKAFKAMKKSAVFVNVTRGGVVNQEDLYNALVSGEIWAAGLDVTTPEPLPTDSPLLTLKNCTITPHLGSATVRTRHQMLELTSKNILAALTGQEMPARLC